MKIQTFGSIIFISWSNAPLHQDGDGGLIPSLVKSRVTNSNVPTEAMKRAVKKKYDYKCGHVNPVTKERCNSRFVNQFDHIVPVALGGKTEIANLRFVCRTHNQLYAIEKLGRDKMSLYMSSLN